MRYFTSDTHFGHPLVTALRGFLNNGRLRTEYRDVWQAQGRAAAHTWIKQYVRDNQTSFKTICDITRHENTIIGNINETVGHDDELWILGDLLPLHRRAHTRMPAPNQLPTSAPDHRQPRPQLPPPIQ